MYGNDPSAANLIFSALAELTDTAVDFRRIGAEEELTRLQLLLKEETVQKQMLHDAKMVETRHQNNLEQIQIENKFNIDLENQRQSFKTDQATESRQHDLNMTLVEGRLEDYNTQQVKIDSLSASATELGIYQTIMDKVPQDGKDAAFLDTQGGIEMITGGSAAPLRGRQLISIALREGIASHNAGYDTAMARDVNKDGTIDESEYSIFSEDPNNKNLVSDPNFMKGFNKYVINPVEHQKLIMNQRTMHADNATLKAQYGNENLIFDSEGFVTGVQDEIDYTKTLNGKIAINEQKMTEKANAIEMVRSQVMKKDSEIVNKRAFMLEKWKDLDPSFVTRDFEFAKNLGEYMTSGDSAKLGESLMTLNQEMGMLGAIEVALNEQELFVENNYAYFSALHTDDGLMSDPEMDELIKKFEEVNGVPITDVGFKAGLNRLMPAQTRSYNLSKDRKDRTDDLDTQRESTYTMLKGLVADKDKPISFEEIEGIDKVTANEIRGAFGSASIKDFDNHVNYLVPNLGEWLRSPKFKKAYPQIWDQLQLIDRNKREIDRINEGALPGAGEQVHKKISELISVPGAKGNIMGTFDAFNAITADMNATQYESAYQHFTSQYTDTWGTDVAPIIREQLISRTNNDKNLGPNLEKVDRESLYGSETPFEQRFTSGQVMEMLDKIDIKSKDLPYTGLEGSTSGVRGIFASVDEGELGYTGWGSGHAKGGSMAPASTYNMEVNTYLKQTWDKAYDNLSATNKDSWGLDLYHYGFGEQTTKDLIGYMEEYYKKQSDAHSVVEGGVAGRKVAKWKKQLDDLLARANTVGRDKVEQRIKAAMQDPTSSDYAVLYDLLMQLEEAREKKGK